MNRLEWEKDVVYLLAEENTSTNYMLKDQKDNLVWESYYKTKDGFQINKTDITFKNEFDARRYCEINAKVKIEEKIKYLQSLLVD